MTHEARPRRSYVARKNLASRIARNKPLIEFVCVRVFRQHAVLQQANLRSRVKRLTFKVRLDAFDRKYKRVGTGGDES